MKNKLKMWERGFTDKLYYYNFRCVWAFTIACFVFNVFSGFLGVNDLAIINYGIPAAWGELGLHTGFVIWKAKAENMSKYGKGVDYEN